MAKPLKIVLFVIGGVVLLIIAALVAAAALFNPNDYRGKIQDAVKEQTGRDLALGEIQMKIFPWLRVSLADARLGNAAGIGNEPFAEVRNVSVGVQLLPLLLDKQVKVSTVTLEGLHLNLARNKDGVSNWQDLVQHQEQKSERAPAPQTKAESQFSLDSIDIGGIAISDAAIVYDDAQVGARYELQKLKLETGSLRSGEPFDLSLSVTALSKAPELKADIALDGTITADLKTQKFATRDLKLTVNGLRATLSKDKNGHSNWEHLLKAADTQPEATQDKTKSALDLNDIGIAGIEVNDAALVYSDAQAGSRYELNRFNFKTGAFTPGKDCDIDLRSSVTSAEPATTVDVSLSGTLSPDFKNNRLDTRDLKLGVKGKALDYDIDTTIKTRLIADLAAQVFNLKTLSVEAKVGGKPIPDGTQSIQASGDLAYNAKEGALRFADGKLKAADLALTTDITGRNLGGDGARLSGPLSVAPFNPRKLLEDFGIKLNTADPKALTQASFSAQIGGTPSSVSLQNVAITLDQTQLKGNFSVEDFKTLALAFALQVDSIDLDRYLPPKAKEEGKVETTSGEKKDLNAVELPGEALSKLNAEGTFDVAKLKVKNLKLSDIRLKLSGRGAQTAKQQDLSAQLYGGRVTLSHRYTPGVTPGYAIKTQLSSFQAAPFLLDFTGKDSVSGVADFSADLSGRGKTVGDLRRTLSGKLAAQARNGAVKGFNLGQIIRKAEAAMAGNLNYTENSAPETDFAAISVSGTVSNGVLHSDDLSAASPLFRVGGAGDINLVDETINYTARPTIVETSKGQGGKELSQLNGVTIPIRLSGSLWKPKYKVDISDAVREKAKQKIEEKLADPEVKQKINDKLGELLFGKKKKKDPPAEQPAEQPPAESQPPNQ